MELESVAKLDLKLVYLSKHPQNLLSKVKQVSFSRFHESTLGLLAQ